MLSQPFHRGVHSPRQFGAALRHNSPRQVADEGRVDNGPVFIFDITVADDVVYVHQILSAGKCSQGRREQKKPNAPFLVPRDDGRQDRKRRVVQNNAPLWIILRLIVLARPERPDDPGLINSVLLTHPVAHRVVYFRRGHAVICCQLRLKFLYKLFVGCHSPSPKQA